MAIFRNQQLIKDIINRNREKGISDEKTISSIIERRGLDTRAKKVFSSFKETGNISQGLDQFLEIPIDPTVQEEREVRGKLGTIARFLGVEKLGKRIGFELAARTPQTRAIIEAERARGQLTEEELTRLRTGGVTGREVLGSAIQTAAQIALPGVGGQIFRGASVLARTTPIARNVIQSSALRFGSFSGILGFGRAIEEEKTLGESIKSGAIATAIGAMIPLAGRAVAGTVKNVIPEILGAFIQRDASVIQRAFSNPQQVAQAISRGIMASDVRRKALTSLKKYNTRLGTNFGKGIKELQGANPQATVRRSKQDLTTLKNDVDEQLQEFNIFPTKVGRLNFTKKDLPSSIKSSAEKKQIQDIYRLITRQRNYSFNSVDAISKSITKLERFTEGAAPSVKSRIAGDLRKFYANNVVEPLYPGLAILRKEFSTGKKITQEMTDLIQGTSKGRLTPQKAVSASKRLTRVFKDDEEEFIHAVNALEKELGIDVVNELAGSRFVPIVSRSFGSPLFQAGALAGGLFYNPFIFLTLPLFSPRFVGVGATIIGRGAQIAQRASRTRIGELIGAITKRGVRTAVSKLP